MRNTPFPVPTSNLAQKFLNDPSSINKGGQNPDSYAETVLGPPPGVRQFMPQIRQRRVEWRYLELMRKAGKLDLAVKYGRRLC